MNVDIDYNEVFGVEPEGANEQDPAEPVSEDTSESNVEGANEQAPAEPADDTQRQSSEENAKYAAARRRAEQDAAATVEKVRRETATELDNVISSLKLVNPYTNVPITTKAEYDSYMLQKRQETESKLITASGMSDAEFAEYKNSIPEVVAAREHMEEMRRAEADRKINDEIAKISAFDSTVKSIKDVASSPVFEAVNNMVKRGYDLSDAWKLANSERLSAVNIERSKQAVINSYNGKNHMTPTSSRGEGMVRVPDDVLDMYKTFNPDMSVAEITRHYNKNLKK